ncbi:MAG: serine/threonine-protein phosphatase [Muribaculaceae bacterium]|nr:serine/threonine-protein phosphatase [Muribaculaceae bacterium]
MKYKLKAYQILEFGKRKDSESNPHQEDSIYPPLGANTSGSSLFMVCDGMGGHDAGEVASQTVCEVMSQSILMDGHDEEGIFTNMDLLEALDSAYIALDKKDNGAEKKMGTTLALLKFHNDGATIAHIGDSRVYHIRPGETEKETEILFMTEDHSLVNSLVKAGEMTREDARHSKQRNIITRAMQPGVDRCEADIALITDIKPGDYFYLCSDGMLEQDEMDDGSALKRIFSNEIPSLEEKVKILQGATAHNSDNHSAYIIHVLDVEEDKETSNQHITEEFTTFQPKKSLLDKFLSHFRN